MKNLLAALAALALVLIGCKSTASAVPAPRHAPSVLIVPFFAVVGDIRSSKSVSVYKINGSTGALTLVAGSPFAAGIDPKAGVLARGGRFAYVLNGDSKNISAYRVNAATGALTPVAGSPFALDYSSSDPMGITVDPAGKYFYAVFDPGISAFSINATTGALARVPGSPFDTNPSDSTGTASIAVDPSDRFAYVLNSFRHTVSAYRINAAGALKLAGSPLDMGRNSNDTRGFKGVTIDPKGKFVYVTGPCCVYVYTINATTGALAAAAHISLGYHPSGEELTEFAIDPTGKFAYAVDGSRVYAYTINATTGIWKAIAGQKFAVPAGADSYRVTIDPTGKFAYVFNRGDRAFADTISAYRIDSSSGGLTQLAHSPVAVDANNTDPIARWFNAGRCAAFEKIAGWSDWTHAHPPPLAKRDLGDIIDLSATRIPSRYSYDPKSHFALYFPPSDCCGTFTLRTSAPPPAGVPQHDLSKLHTASGIKLGSTAEMVVRLLGRPRIVTGCGLQRYIYLRSRDPAPTTTLQFTIGNGRVIEIYQDFGG